MTQYLRQTRIKQDEADEVIANLQMVAAQWPEIASSVEVPRREQELIAPAFRLAARVGD